MFWHLLLEQHNIKTKNEKCTHHKKHRCVSFWECTQATDKAQKPLCPSVRTVRKQLHSQVCLSRRPLYEPVSQWHDIMSPAVPSCLLPVSPVLHPPAGDSTFFPFFFFFTTRNHQIIKKKPLVLFFSLLTHSSCTSLTQNVLLWGKRLTHPSFLTC